MGFNLAFKGLNSIVYLDFIDAIPKLEVQY